MISFLASEELLRELPGDVAEAAILEDIDEAGLLHEAVEEIGGGELAELKVRRPRLLVVLIHHDLVLERVAAGDAVVDVVERAVVDVMLLLPEAAHLIVRVTGVVKMRLVLTLEITPYTVSLLRRQRRLGIADILELVDHRPVRDEHDGILKMHPDVVLRAGAEEKIHPRLGENSIDIEWVSAVSIVMSLCSRIGSSAVM